MKRDNDNVGVRGWKDLTKKPERKSRVEYYWLLVFPGLYLILFGIFAMKSGHFDTVTPLSACVMVLCGVPVGLYTCYYDGAGIYLRVINVVIMALTIILLITCPIG